MVYSGTIAVLTFLLIPIALPIFAYFHRIDPLLGYVLDAFFILMLFNPIAMACTYAGLGMVVGLSHLIFPNPEENSWKADAAEVQNFERELIAA